MFRRVSAVFRCHVLHIFYAADGLRLARDTAHTESVVRVVTGVRVDFAGTRVYVVGEVTGVHSGGPPEAAATNTVHVSRRIEVAAGINEVLG